MPKSHRKVLIRIIEGAALALVLLDAVLFLAVLRPLQNRETRVWTQLSETRHRVQETQVRVARLERFRANLPDAQEQLATFERDHIPPRRQGFSRVARLVRRLSEQSNLELSGVSYRLDAGREEPLERLGVELNVEGNFPDLMKFTHALETASDMIVLRDFTFGPGESGRVEMRLTADLYLSP
jgi:Tfp pilus assembly protein PilO